MSRGVNKVILLGTLGKDPEIRYSQSGSALCSLSLATNEKWKDKNGEVQERTEWHRVKLFGRLAEVAGEYLVKGGQVYIEGSLRTEKYTDKQGVEKYSTDVIAQELQLLGSGGGGEQTGRSVSGGGRGAPSGGGRGGGDRAPSGGRGGGERAAGERGAPAPMSDEIPDDDIPF